MTLAELSDALEQAALDYEAAWTKYKDSMDADWTTLRVAKGHAHQALIDAVRAYREGVNHDR